MLYKYLLIGFICIKKYLVNYAFVLHISKRKELSSADQMLHRAVRRRHLCNVQGSFHASTIQSGAMTEEYSLCQEVWAGVVGKSNMPCRTNN